MSNRSGKITLPASSRVSNEQNPVRASTQKKSAIKRPALQDVSNQAQTSRAVRQNTAKAATAVAPSSLVAVTMPVSSSSSSSSSSAASSASSSSSLLIPPPQQFSRPAIIVNHGVDDDDDHEEEFEIDEDDTPMPVVAVTANIGDVASGANTDNNNNNNSGSDDSDDVIMNDISAAFAQPNNSNGHVLAPIAPPGVLPPTSSRLQTWQTTAAVAVLPLQAPPPPPSAAATVAPMPAPAFMAPRPPPSLSSSSSYRGLMVNMPPQPPTPPSLMGRESWVAYLETLNEYSLDVHQYLMERQAEFALPASFLEMRQRDVNQAMRTVLIDWLVEVCEEYELLQDTLFLAVSVLDRFLAAIPIIKEKLQLLGISCLFVASKYYEAIPPSADQLVYIAANTYEKIDLFRMEAIVLNTLGFRVSNPIATEFLNMYIHSQNGPVTRIHELHAQFLLELLLEQPQYNHFTPSVVAAAAIYVSQRTLALPVVLYDHPQQVKECAQIINAYYNDVRTRVRYRAVIERYEHQARLRVSTINARPHIV